MDHKLPNNGKQLCAEPKNNDDIYRSYHNIMILLPLLIRHDA